MVSPGPTIISPGTLREVGSWFRVENYEELSRRFRANIEIVADLPSGKTVCSKKLAELLNLKPAMSLFMASILVNAVWHLLVIH